MRIDENKEYEGHFVNGKADGTGKLLDRSDGSQARFSCRCKEGVIIADKTHKNDKEYLGFNCFLTPFFLVANFLPFLAINAIMQVGRESGIGGAIGLCCFFCFFMSIWCGVT